MEEGDKNRSKLKDEYEYHLKKLGVEDSFANLNVDTIYAVLNALPQIEGSEETARRLYAALIRSDRVFGDDELLRCEAYLKFKRSGLVLCRASYEPLSEAWYLSSRGISDKVAASYKLIELPRRMNSEKIQRLLGVSKLELKGEVYGEPRIHTLNPVFQTDYAKYKPMAYCYRLGKGTKEEARRFSQLTITLCESLTAKYNEAIADLADYDFIMDSPSHFYLQAPAKKDIDALKMDVNFSAAVSNVLCTLIDVGDVFPLFRELYGVSDASRQALILQMFEDPSILEQVKQEFDNTVDRRKEFLGVVAQLSGKSPSSIAKLVSGIDFRSFESVDSAPAMINCFRKLKIDVAAYNELSENSKIDLTEYYRSQITNVLYLKYKERYMLSRYNELKKKRLAEKKRLTRLFDHYRQIVVPIENSVYFDYEDAFVRQLSLHRNNPKINLIDLYHEHLEAWKAEDQTRRYVEAFLDEPENRSLVYFREFKALDQAYIEFLAMQEIEDDDSDGEELEENPHHDTSLELVEVELAALEPVASASQTAGKFSVLQKSTVSSSSKASVRTGERGEQLVYDLLKSNYPSVRWVSEYAKKARVNPEGRAGLGYDMEYVDEKGQRKFIEVKASKISDIAFYLSEPEMEFALKNNRDYAICFVADAETDKPRIMVLRDIIADGELDSGKFSVTVKKEYRLESRIVRQETVKKTQTEDDMTVSEAAIHDEGV